MQEETVKHFPVEGVIVVVPPEVGAVKVKRLPFGSFHEKPIQGDPEELETVRPFRAVINFVVEPKDTPGQYLTEFDPPITLRVRYTAADLRHAELNERPLRLVYWDDSSGRWRAFTKEKHNFRWGTYAGAAGGEGIAEISNWGDPPVGWAD